MADCCQPQPLKFSICLPQQGDVRHLMVVMAWFLSIPPIWSALGIIALWLGTVVLVAELMHRSKSVDPELVRKVVHIGIGNVIVLAWWLQIPTWIGVGASVLFSAIALVSYRVPILPSINSVDRHSMGTFFYAVSFAVLIGCFWPLHQPHYAALGILVMTWGDGLAALIGQRWGRHPYKLWGMKKSWEGSLTMAIATYGVSALVLWAAQGSMWQTWIVPVAIALAATALEAFSRFGIDNLTVPLGSAVVGFGLNQLLQDFGGAALSLLIHP